MELFPFLIFAILKLSCLYLWKYKRESNETWYIERRPPDSALSKNCNSVTSNYWVTSRLNFCNNKLLGIISLKVFYSFTNITLLLLRIFGEHPSVSPILLFTGMVNVNLIQLASHDFEASVWLSGYSPPAWLHLKITRHDWNVSVEVSAAEVGSQDPEF